MGVSQTLWGQDRAGNPVHLYTLDNGRGLRTTITSYGARVVSLWATDRRGEAADVVLGFDDLDSYMRTRQFFGALVGRVANRIAGAQFKLDGVAYRLTANQGAHHIHGGGRSFSMVTWQGGIVDQDGQPTLRLTYRSVDGEEGYPGNLDVACTYTLTTDNALRIDYEAVSDKDTIINLTNHSYFNLAGAGDIQGHELSLNADAFTPGDAARIPTGEIRPVEGTAMDLRRATSLGVCLAAADEQVRMADGFDHNWVLSHAPRALVKVAELYEPQSGRLMETWTTEPGVQVFTSNTMNGSIIGKGGVAYQKYAAICLETQHFPDAPNHANFPSIVLRVGEQFRSTTVYRFGSR